MLAIASISSPASSSGASVRLASISGLAGDVVAVVLGVLIFGLLLILVEGIDRI